MRKAERNNSHFSCSVAYLGCQTKVLSVGKPKQQVRLRVLMYSFRGSQFWSDIYYY